MWYCSIYTFVPKLECNFSRCWVARNFAVWRTHTRTSIIDPHALSHRTSIFDDHTRTRTLTFSKRVQSFIPLSKKIVLLQLFLIFSFYLVENVLTTRYYFTYTNLFIFHYLSSPDTFTCKCNFSKSIFFNIFQAVLNQNRLFKTGKDVQRQKKMFENRKGCSRLE